MKKNIAIIILSVCLAITLLVSVASGYSLLHEGFAVDMKPEEALTVTLRMICR